MLREQTVEFVARRVPVDCVIDVSCSFSDLVLCQMHAALFILRVISKHFIAIDSEHNLYPYFLPHDKSSNVSRS